MIVRFKNMHVEIRRCKISLTMEMPISFPVFSSDTAILQKHSKLGMQLSCRMLVEHARGCGLCPHMHTVYIYIHRFICTVLSPCFVCALSIKLSITQTFTRYSNSIPFHFTCYCSPWWFILLKRLNVFLQVLK